MIAEIGTLLLVLALAASLLQGLGAIPALSRNASLRVIVGKACWLQALMLTLAFMTLILLRLDDDFTVANVAQHSNRALPLLYKISGSWGNHEGSMLLWVWLLSAYGLIFSANQYLPKGTRVMTLGLQALLGTGLLLFILLTSNPFARIFPPPEDGAALNPLLQDVALAIHPPLLYAGYVGFSVVFCLSLTALLSREIHTSWARVTQGWILLSWSTLTLGIALGSWWAYRELGWGGWWFWDPVENASLLPWLCGTALLHANLVLQRRGLLTSWVLLLGIVTFGFSLLGTFLVRSGVLTSVHSFASDPSRGIFILCYIAVVMGGALTIFGQRIKAFSSDRKALPLSREGFVVINNMLLLAACAAVALGTLYPLFAQWLGQDSITLGAPYFNRAVLPLLALPAVGAVIAGLLPWKRASARRLMRSLRFPVAVFLFIALGVLALAKREALIAAIGFGLSGWLLAGTLLTPLKRLRAGQRLGAPLLAMALAHGGAAFFIAGVTGHGLWQHQQQFVVEPQSTFLFSGRSFEVTNLAAANRPNYTVQSVELVSGSVQLRPELRRYKIGSMETSEAAIASLPTHDIYAVLGRSPDGKELAVRMYENPFVSCLWIGALLMAAGGLIPLLTRKVAL